MMVSSDTGCIKFELVIIAASGALNRCDSASDMILAVSGVALKRTLPESRNGSCGIVIIELRISSLGSKERS
jgi:hypothetical protein